MLEATQLLIIEAEDHNHEKWRCVEHEAGIDCKKQVKAAEIESTASSEYPPNPRKSVQMCDAEQHIIVVDFVGFLIFMIISRLLSSPNEDTQILHRKKSEEYHHQV